MKSLACRGLDGQTDSIVEFDYDGSLCHPFQNRIFTALGHNSYGCGLLDPSGDPGYSESLELINPDSREPLTDLEFEDMTYPFRWRLLLTGSLIGLLWDRLTIGNLKSVEPVKRAIYW